MTTVPNKDYLLNLMDDVGSKILTALKVAGLPPEVQMAILGGCLAEVLKGLPQDQQLPVLINHILGLRSLGFEESIGVLPVAVPVAEEKNNDGLSEQDRNATRH